MLYQKCSHCHRVCFTLSIPTICRQCQGSPRIPLDLHDTLHRLFQRLEYLNSSWKTINIQELFHILSILIAYKSILRDNHWFPSIRRIIENHLWKFTDSDVEFDLFQWFLTQFGNSDEIWDIYDEVEFNQWVETYDFQEWNIFHLIHVCWSPRLFNVLLQKLSFPLRDPTTFLFISSMTNRNLLEWLDLCWIENRMNDDDYFLQLLRFNLLYIDLLDLYPFSKRKHLPFFLPSSIQKINYLLLFFLFYYRPHSHIWRASDLIDHLCLHFIHDSHSDFILQYPNLQKMDEFEFEDKIGINQVVSYFQWTPPPSQFVLDFETQLSFLSYMIHRRQSSHLHFEFASYLLSIHYYESAYLHFIRSGDYQLLCRLFNIPYLSKDLSIPIWNHPDEFILFLLQSTRSPISPI